MALPARDLVERHRNGYHCLLFKPVWLVETARGCPYRCNFCSVWQLYGRSFRERSIASVVEDLASVGEHVFIADGTQRMMKAQAYLKEYESSLVPAVEVIPSGAAQAS